MTKLQFDYVNEISAQIRYFFKCVPFVVCDFIACQSALETDFGSSKICKENCNLFGMKNPVLRLTTSIGENRGHALYTSRFESIADYFLWLQWSKFNQSVLRDLDRFKVQLSRSSFNPNPDYVDSVNNVYQSFLNYEN